MILRDSKYWLSKNKGLLVINPDGWDRLDFEKVGMN